MTPEQIREHAFDAMCVWEELLERRRKDGVPYFAGDFDLNEYWDRVGTAQMRYDAIMVSDWVYKAWSFVPEDDKSTFSFDWEWVPRFLDLVVWSAEGYTMPDPEDTAKKVRHELFSAYSME